MDYKALSKLDVEQGRTVKEKYGPDLKLKNCTNFAYNHSEIESSIVTDVSAIDFFQQFWKFPSFIKLAFINTKRPTEFNTKMDLSSNSSVRLMTDS